MIPSFGVRANDSPAPVSDQHSIRQIFEEILGQSARFIQPVLFRSGKLNVYAQAAVWAQHIQHRNERLFALFNKAGIHVTEINVKVRPDFGETQPREIKRVSTYDSVAASKHLERFAAQLADNTLCESVTKLANRIRKNASAKDEKNED